MLRQVANRYYFDNILVPGGPSKRLQGQTAVGKKGEDVKYFTKRNEKAPPQEGLSVGL